MQNFNRQYKILPPNTSQYPPTGDCTTASSFKEFSESLQSSALRLNCIAFLLELYEMPQGLEEAVEDLESIAKFYSDRPEK